MKWILIECFRSKLKYDIELMFNTSYNKKTHGHWLFDTNLHEVTWHLQPTRLLGLAVRSSRVLSSIERVKISVKESLQMDFCFCPIFAKHIQQLYPLKTASKGGDFPSMIAMTPYCFGALSEVHVIGRRMIGREREPVWPDSMDWWMQSRFQVFTITEIKLIALKLTGKFGAMVCSNQRA